MNFDKLHLLPYILISLVVFIFLYVRKENLFYKWVNDHWFFERSSYSKIASFLFLSGLALLAVSLLDLRGKEIKIESKIPEQKTIILIDTSASMLVEDVRPNRFEKVLFLARHFVKRAYGHQISVVLFSDFQKQVVPFTTDIDLLDARIASLKVLRLGRGGSNLSMAIQESLGYLKTSKTEFAKISGNVLVFTDSEETSTPLSLDVPDGVSVSVVGVGTLKGGPIPIRTSTGNFKGYKKFQGKEIVSKLGETLIKKMADDIKYFRYWIATSYSIPTEEIIRFFNSVHKIKYSKGDIRIKPVLIGYLTLPALALIILGTLFRMAPSFAVPFVLFGFILSTPSMASEQAKPIQVEQAKLPLELIKKMKSGKASKSERLKLGELLLRAKKFKEAAVLYDETLGGTNLENLNSNDLFNYTTSLLASKNLRKGIPLAKNLYDRLESEDLKSLLKDNVKMALNQKQQDQKKKKEKEKEDKKKKDQKDQDQKGQKDDKKDGEGKEGGEKKQKDSQGGKGDQQKEQDSKDQEGESKEQGKGEKEKKEKGEKGDKDKDKDQDGKGKEKKAKKRTAKKKQGQKPMRKKKIPAQLKQLLSDDRKIQNQYMDTTTSDKRHTNQKTKGNAKKDW